MKYFFILSFLFSLLAFAQEPKQTEKPNIILFFVDDMGWDDLSYRDPRHETPNLDQLAADGVDFQHASIPCPTCSPSRASLVTGQHPTRLQFFRHIPLGKKFGADKFGRHKTPFNLWPKDPAQIPSRNWLPLENTTYAEALAKLNYHNLFVGKWHLGHEPHHPKHQGFHQQIGVTNWGNPHSYYPPYFRNKEVFAEEKERYLTDKLTDETVKFIHEYELDQPFMISFWYYAVHSPLDGRKDKIDHFIKKGFSEKEANYASMLYAMDESIGRIRQAITQKKIADNTILIFLSDQGSQFENAPLRGGKSSETIYEGGARVPLFIHWPGVTQKGKKITTPVQSIDLFPTLVEIAGGKPAAHKNLDGISLVETLKTDPPLKRKHPLVGYRAYQDLYASAREDDWKLIAYRSGKVELYHLTKDPSEQADVSKKHPEITTRLRKKLASWEQEMGVSKYSGIQ